MALYTNYSLFIDVENGVASKSYQDVNPLGDPAFFSGDHSVLNVYFVKPNNISAAPYEEVVISGLASVNVAIGTPSAVATSTSGLTLLGTATATVSTVVPYSFGVNQIDRITIAPTPKSGSFSLVYNGTNLLPILPITATASEVHEALASYTGMANFEDHVTVTKVGDFTWDITYDQNYIAPPAALTALSAGIISFVGYEVVLDMTTAGVTTLLGSNASASATLEISTTQSGTSYVQTAAQIPCTVFEHIL
jgi:hypothetical protein